MFTGLIAECGRIVGRSESGESGRGGGLTLAVEHSSDLAQRLAIGASLAVSGVCLTVIEITERTRERAVSTFDLSAETLARSTLGSLAMADRVNLEPALRMGDPMGGHWVQGHVDGVATLLAKGVAGAGESREIIFSIPAGQQGYLVEKGSVTLDGVSLTVASAAADRFSVWFVPHTLAVTTFGRMPLDARLNFEADVLAKYVERAVSVHGSARSSWPDGALS